MKKINASILTRAIASELRAERARKRITFGDLADSVDYSQPTVHNYLHSKREMPLMAFLDICEALEVSPSAIINKAEVEAANQRAEAPKVIPFPQQAAPDVDDLDIDEIAANIENYRHAALKETDEMRRVREAYNDIEPA